MLDFPDSSVLCTVLGLTSRAPYADDWQPWRWQVGAGALHLFAGPGSHLLPAAPDRRAVLLSCGAALHHCTVALAAMGWRATVHRLPDSADPFHLARIELAAQPGGELDVLLASAIGRRCSHSRDYGSWPVAWGHIAVMGARTARAGVMLRRIEAPSPSVNDGSVVVALGTEDDTALARLRAGEATSLVLLSATAMGLASCPVSEQLDSPDTREALRADVFGGSGYPQAMVRIGWAALNAFAPSG